MNADSHLACRNLRCGYGRVTAVRNVDLDVSPGKVLALLGPNGAGKTTLMLTLAGLLPRQAGEVIIGDHKLRSGSPRAAVKAGMVLVPDDRALFGPLTVREHIELVTANNVAEQTKQLLDLFPALEPRWEVTASNLSGGEQQMLAMARGLAQNPRVLLIDEMSMGVAPIIVESMLAAVRRIADETGTTVVLVEQHVRLALEHADLAAVLVHGEIALRGDAGDLAGRLDEVEAAYLGDRSHPSADLVRDAHQN